MNKSKQLFKRAALILTAVLLLTAAVFTVILRLNRKVRTGTTNLELNHNDNIVVTTVGAEGNMKISLMADYGGEFEPSPEIKKYIITATLGPVTAENKEILWSVKWKESSGGNHSGGTEKAISWSNNKDVSDYVTISDTTSVSGEGISLTCIKDFGAQIILTATAAGNSEVQATCLVDYCQKIKSVNYAFKYGDSSMGAVSADSDGVYRVDYTGEEKSYFVECEPVYTDYTVEDEFVKSVSGSFTSAFGHTANNAMTEISLQAGLFGCVNEPALSEAAEDYLKDADLLITTVGWQVGYSLLQELNTAYGGLSETEKTHSKIINRNEAVQKFVDKCGSGEVFYAAREEALQIINEYKAPSPSGDFNGGIELDSVDMLLTAANICNTAKTGIVEYTITFEGAYSEETFTLKLGYTESSVKAIRNITISMPSVLF